MIADILNIDEFIRIHGSLEVTTTNIREPDGIGFSDNGLGSIRIFGNPTSNDRKTKTGYISLNDYFIHPLVYYTLTRLKKSDIPDLVQGKSFFKIENGELKKINDKDKINSEKYGTGIRWLKDVWDDIDFTPKVTDAKETRNRKSFLASIPKNTAFINKFIVIAAFYRDIDLSSTKNNEFNSRYIRMINYASGIKQLSNIVDIRTEIPAVYAKMQELLLDLFKFIMDRIGGTKGWIHKYIMGKPTDYSARLVISAPQYNYENVEDVEVDFHKSAIPLSTATSTFITFMIPGIRRYVKNIVHGNRFTFVLDKESGKPVKKELASHWESVLSHDNLKKKIELYNDSFDHRLDLFELELEDGSKAPIYISVIDLDNDENEISRRTEEINLSYLFYIVAKNELSDKHSLVTRYPIEDFNNIFPSEMNIIPANKTKKVKIHDITYDRFPDFSDFYSGKVTNINQLFTDTFRFFPTYASALGADYDGDQISNQSVFTNEANEECHNVINSNINIINIEGDTMRKTGQVTAHTLFNMTYKIKEPKMLSEVEKQKVFEKLRDLNTKTRSVLYYLFNQKFDKETKQITDAPFKQSDTFIAKKGSLPNLKEDIQTNIGIYIFNLYVLSNAFGGKIDYNNNVLNGKEINRLDSLISSKIMEGVISTAEYKKYTDNLVFIGYMTELFVPGIEIDFLYPNPEVKKLKDELVKKYAKDIAENNTESYINNIQKPLLNKAKEVLQHKESYRLYELGGKPSWNNNYRSNTIGVGPIQDLLTDERKIIVNSYVEGQLPQEKPYFANSAILASYNRGVSTQEGGSMVKLIFSGAQNVELDNEKHSDCGTTLTNDIVIEKDDVKDYMYRYIYDTNGKLVELTPDVINNYINKSVKMRSSLFCRGIGKEKKICNHCFGDLYRRINIDKAGFTATKPGSKLMQLSLKSMHDTSLDTKKIDISRYCKIIN